VGLKIRGLQLIALFVITAAALCAAPAVVSISGQGASASPRTPDYEFFKGRVEPIFLKKRPGHARCYACHGSGTGPQYLVPLPPGADFWTEEQSRKIFRNVSAFVDSDDPMSSLILIHPLSPMAGGDITFAHGGGRQFESKEDPDWKIISQWVNGATLTRSPKP
jgi:hypothetical protein